MTEAGEHRRGTLRLYLGAAPGVGKTFAMLNEGRRRRERGTDVVVGFVETHGRTHTAEQIGDLEVVPRRAVSHRGSTLPLGIVLLLMGLFFVLSRSFHWTGPGATLLLIGAIFLALSAARGFRGPLLPGAILLGLGAGFLLVAAIDRAGGRERRPSPLLPGVVLVLLAGLGALSRRTPVLEVLAGVRDLWPWALVVAGALIVGQALWRRKT